MRGPRRFCRRNSTDVDFNLYPGQRTPIPVIRNEELILLRAEANIGLGQFPEALTDISHIRTTAGSLPAIASFATPTEAVDATLFERRAARRGSLVGSALKVTSRIANRRPARDVERGRSADRRTDLNVPLTRY